MVQKLLFTIILSFLLSPIYAQITISSVVSNFQFDNMLRYDVYFYTSENCKAYIVFEDENNTHYSNISADTDNHKITLYGLTAETDYSFIIYAFDQSGEYSSEQFFFSTETYPNNIATQIDTLINNESENNGFFSLNGRFAATEQLRILNRDGQVVWYEIIYPTGAPCVGYNWTNRNTFLYIAEDCHTLKEINLAGELINQIDISTWADLYHMHHEIYINDEGNYMALIAEVQTVDQTSVGGVANAQVVGDGYIEFDQDGNLVDYWTVFDHYDPLYCNEDSVFWSNHFDNGMDWFHANSLSEDLDGNYLLSLSKQNQFIKINKTSGEVMWTLGENGDFDLSPASAYFDGQHSITATGENRYLLFDNKGGSSSRTLEFELNLDDNTAQRIFEYIATPPILTPVLGNAAQLTNGNIMTCFGQRGIIHETDSFGNLLWAYSNPISSYRSYFIDHLYQPLPDLFALDSAYCLDDLAGVIPTNLAGGYFSGTGIINGLFVPQEAGIGIHTIQYHYAWSSAELEITVTAPISPPLIQVNENQLSTSSTAASYQWYLNGSPIEGAINTSWTAEENGNYMLEVSNGACTVFSETLTINTVSTSSITEAKLTFHPNPVKNYLSIDYGGLTIQSISIFDFTGKQIKHLNTEEIIDLTTLTNGCYFIQVQLKDGHLISKKIVKQ